MRVKAIINPAAGRQTAQEDALLVLSGLAQDGFVREFTVFYTHERNDAFFEAKKLQKGEYDLILAVGGDGTVNEVVNGLLRSGADIPLSILSAGTSNDLAGYLGYPTDIYEYEEMLKRKQIRRVDVAKCGERYFLNALIGGLLADVAHKVPQELKNIFGRMAYYITGVADVPGKIFDSVPLVFEADGQTVEENVILFVITNTQTAGGFKKLSPLASMEDGLFDVCVIKKAESLDKLLNMFRLLLQGGHIQDPQVRYFQARRLKISAPGGEKVVLDMDGESAGDLPLSLEVLPGALPLLAPWDGES